MQLQKITPYLWYDNQAEEAARFYCSVFRNSKLLNVSPMLVGFELEGMNFMALNGGPQFTFNEAVSFFVTCDDQAEVDHYWEKLTADGGRESRCGWLKDRFGVSWQIVPVKFMELAASGAQENTRRMFEAMMQMNKMDMQQLQDAYDGK